LRLIARRTLGKHFSYALRTLEDHQLVTQGIYGHLRHPAYTGDLLVQLGVTLLFSSLAGFLLMLLLIPCFLYRIKIEEEMLGERFGERYRAYAKRSKRLLPYVY
jgi:protein-S-isoprenylcysteine O-methyltransferase Ste14